MPDVVSMRYLGDEPRYVPLLRRVVEPDQVVGVAPALFESRAWPDSQWRREDTPRARRTSTKDGE